jgi:hypothetical protein
MHGEAGAYSPGLHLVIRLYQVSRIFLDFKKCYHQVCSCELKLMYDEERSKMTLKG